MTDADWEHDFAEYFAARVTALRRLAYGLCGDWHRAEDLVQVTFLRLYRHWRRIRTETVDAYARRTLVNAFLTDRRDRRREDVSASPPDRAAPCTDPSQAVDLSRALAGLPAQQRAAVVLRHLEDLPVAEVAALLGVAEGTVKSQTARGVQALRAALSPSLLTKEV
jgi:RNA polymerase sigma-70 factor (sigma-E family)